MKKKTKILTSVLSAAIMAANLVVPAFADTSVKIFEGKNHIPTRQETTTEYKGILISMNDGEAPTAEELGIDENSEITLYDNQYSFIGLGGTWAGDLYLGELISLPTGNDTTYFISGDYISEEDAAELIKTLKVRNEISLGEMFYKTTFETATMYVHSGVTSVFVYCKDSIVNSENTRHTPTEEDKNLFGFKELSDHGLEIENIHQSNRLYATGSYIEYEIKYDADNCWDFYENLCSIFDEVKANNADDENFEDISVQWIAPITANSGNGLYSVEPTWGDATNDDKIDLNDAIEIAKYIMGSSNLDEDTVLLADINRDGKTDIYDVIEIAKTLLS